MAKYGINLEFYSEPQFKSLARDNQKSEHNELAKEQKQQ
jgi:hypothetical protein